MAAAANPTCPGSDKTKSNIILSSTLADLHGDWNPSIPAADVDKHRQALPQAPIYVYEGAGHAFNRDVDPKAHAPEAAALAWERTIAFLEAQLR